MCGLRHGRALLRHTAAVNEGQRFPRAPHGQRHLYAVCRFDRALDGADPTDAFVLTRGYWSEDEANRKAVDRNAATDDSTVYFVLPVRVAEPGCAAQRRTSHGALIGA